MRFICDSIPASTSITTAAIARAWPRSVIISAALMIHFTGAVLLDTPRGSNPGARTQGEPPIETKGAP